MQDIFSRNELRVFCCFTIHFFCIDDLRLSISFLDTVYRCSCCIVEFFNLQVNSHEFKYSSLPLSMGLMIPIPPSLHGGALKFFISSDICKSLKKS